MLHIINNPWTITIISGIIVVIIAFLINKFFGKKSKPQEKNKIGLSWKNSNTKNMDTTTIVSPDNTNGNNNINININEKNGNKEKNDNQKNINDLKKIINILFIDDDVNFNIVKILKKQGWINTKIITDIVNLDKYNDIHIFFVDINGVGKKLKLKNEGMDLALCLKKNFNDKKVILYSSDTNRDMSHEVFKKIDWILPKNAQIYEFTDLLKQFSRELNI